VRHACGHPANRLLSHQFGYAPRVPRRHVLDGTRGHDDATSDARTAPSRASGSLRHSFVHLSGPTAGARCRTRRAQHAYRGRFIRRGYWLDPAAGQVQFSVYADSWISDHLLKPRTEELYWGLLKNHLKPTFGGMYLGGIHEVDVRRWRKERLRAGPKQARPFGPITVAKAYRLLHTIMATAVDDGRIRRNLCRIKGAGQEHSDERPVITVANLVELLDNVPERYRALLLLATFANLRFGELAGLRRNQVDLGQCEVRVLKATAETDGGLLIDGDPKSPASIRTVAFPREIAPELADHLERFAAPPPARRVWSSSGRRAVACAGRTSASSGTGPGKQSACPNSTSTAFAIQTTRWRPRKARASRSYWSGWATQARAPRSSTCMPPGTATGRSRRAWASCSRTPPRQDRARSGHTEESAARDGSEKSANHSSDQQRNERAGDGNRTRMTSLEDRYRSIRLDVLIRTRWSRTSNVPLMTVSALRIPLHLARTWPTDLPLRRSFHDGRSSAASLARAGLGVVWLPLDVSGFRLVLAHGWHAGEASKRKNKRACRRPRQRNRFSRVTGQRPRHHKIARLPTNSAKAKPPIHSGDRTHHHDQVITPASLSAMNVIRAASGSALTASETLCGRCTRILATLQA
jgi:hypothetical protein